MELAKEVGNSKSLQLIKIGNYCENLFVFLFYN